LRALILIAGGGELVCVFCNIEKIGLSCFWKGAGGLGSEPDVVFEVSSDLTGAGSLKEEFTN
jgi:hypothetical protein